MSNKATTRTLGKIYVPRKFNKAKKDAPFESTIFNHFCDIVAKNFNDQMDLFKKFQNPAADLTATRAGTFLLELSPLKGVVGTPKWENYLLFVKDLLYETTVNEETYVFFTVSGEKDDIQAHYRSFIFGYRTYAVKWAKQDEKLYAIGQFVFKHDPELKAYKVDTMELSALPSSKCNIPSIIDRCKNGKLNSTASFVNAKTLISGFYQTGKVDEPYLLPYVDSIKEALKASELLDKNKINFVKFKIDDEGAFSITTIKTLYDKTKVNTESKYKNDSFIMEVKFDNSLCSFLYHLDRRFVNLAKTRPNMQKKSNESLWPILDYITCIAVITNPTSETYSVVYIEIDEEKFQWNDTEEEDLDEELEEEI